MASRGVEAVFEKTVRGPAQQTLTDCLYCPLFFLIKSILQKSQHLMNFSSFAGYNSH